MDEILKKIPSNFKILFMVVRGKKGQFGETDILIQDKDGNF